MIIKKRAQAILIERGRLLMVRHFDTTIGEQYWCLPGGGIEQGEQPEQAVVRELQEETGLTVRIAAHLGEQHFAGVSQGYAGTVTFVVEAVGGTLTLGYDPEHADWDVKFLQEVAWLPIDGPLLDKLERYFFKKYRNDLKGCLRK
ncbi:NUDIX hydrolase [Paenibacillus sp. MBLB4367]|uniref:NUDIX hydrolase n=1 Tax=Paenibacillus sp. MBLB4367 TaxID=3384767 RepID=UPI0039083376